MTKVELTIDHVGARGDGISQSDEGAIYVPFTLKGERVSAEVSKSRGALIEVLDKSSSRIAPICQHFGECGGCTSQHMSAEAYSAWKLSIAQDALQKVGIDTPIEMTSNCEAGERRRVTLTAKKTNEGTELGYHQAATNDLVAISECPVASNKITDHLAHLNDIARVITLHSKPTQLTVTALDNGLDVSVSGEFAIGENEIQAVIKKVVAGKVIKRLTFNDQVLVETEPLTTTFSDITVFPPAGSFLQASKRAELLMVDIVSKHLKSSKKIADLFSGCGTFTFQLAKKSQVHAAEMSGAALNTIDNAFRIQQGLKQITTERRDLVRRPLMRDELKHFQGAVFDPPRAGAETQAKQLARSVVKKVAAVSCNPTSLARDLTILIDGGFKIKSITAIDQFLFSPHVEVVALLERP